MNTSIDYSTHWGREEQCRFADEILKYISLNENVLIPKNISLKFIPKTLLRNITALVQIMAWRRPGDKPLSEPMMVRSPTHTCVPRSPWVETQMHITKHEVNAGVSNVTYDKLFLNKSMQSNDFLVRKSYGSPTMVANPLCLVCPSDFGMLKSWNGSIFHDRWITRTKASDAEIWCFYICAWIDSWVNIR